MNDDERAAHLDLVVRLGKELVRLGLDRHAAHLRDYYCIVRAGREPTKGWNRAHVIWMAQNLRLPPHHEDLPVRPQGDSPKCCEKPRQYTAATFPAGARIKCAACRFEWISLH